MLRHLVVDAVERFARAGVDAPGAEEGTERVRTRLHFAAEPRRGESECWRVGLARIEREWLFLTE